MPLSAEKRLAALREKQAAIQQQIKDIESAKNRDLRKRQHKREQLIGKLIYNLIEAGDWSEQQLLKHLDTFLTRAADRALFELPKLTTEGVEESSTTSGVSNTSVMSDRPENAPHDEASVEQVAQVPSVTGKPSRKQTKSTARGKKSPVPGDGVIDQEPAAVAPNTAQSNNRRRTLPEPLDQQDLSSDFNL